MPRYSQGKRKSRPPSYKSRELSSDSEDERRRRGSDEDSELLSPSSSEPDTDDHSDDGRDDRRGRKRLVSSRRDSAPSRRSSSPPLSHDPPPASGQRKLMLMLGVAVILCLTFLAGFAVSRYFGSNAGGAASGTETVTVTAGGKSSASASSKASSSASKTSGSAGSSTGTGTTAKETSTGATGVGGSAAATTFPGLSKNGVGIGMLPDYKDQRLSDINEGLGIKSSFYGWYAQLPETGEWDGSQLLEVLDDVKASGAIFQPAVMPNKHNWDGLNQADDYQAQAIARILRKFTDEGIEVWVRIGHEVNWYMQDGTYSGGTGAEGQKLFKDAWQAVAAAVSDNPLVKMFFTPNVAASLDDYVLWFPYDRSTVHIIGVDYYPKSKSESFLERMLPFYSAYCTDGSILWAQGETGIGWEGTAQDKLDWIAQHTSEETIKAMPYNVGVSWFNYDKEVAFKVWKKGDDANNTISKEWFADGTVAEGAKMGNW